jgi:hypothetical protein
MVVIEPRSGRSLRPIFLPPEVIFSITAHQRDYKQRLLLAAQLLKRSTAFSFANITLRNNGVNMLILLEVGEFYRSGKRGDGVGHRSTPGDAGGVYYQASARKE